MKTRFNKLIALAAACALPISAAAQGTTRSSPAPSHGAPQSSTAPHTAGPSTATLSTPAPLGSVPSGNPTSPLSPVPSGNPTSPLSVSPPRPLEPFGGGAFRALDTNGDGFLSRDEAARAQLSGRFQELDVDRDGRLSQSELGATAAPATSSPGRAPGTGGALAREAPQAGPTESVIPLSR